jgi:hypothetical protein
MPSGEMGPRAPGSTPNVVTVVPKLISGLGADFTVGLTSRVPASIP